MTVSLCVAGCGRYARRVFGGLRTRPEGLRLYFASRDEAKARRFNEEFGGSGHFGSYEDAAASPEIDALYFTTPHHVHVENARLAAHHSKHILIEKPIARDTEESLQIIESARAAGVRLMVAENFRFLPTVVKARAMIAGGDIGEVRLMRVWSESHRSPSGWRANAGLRGGGPLIDGGIHLVDVMVNLCGFPEAVSAVTLPKAHSTEGEDGVVVVLRFTGGAVGHLTLDTGSQAADPGAGVTIDGSEGRLSFEPYGDRIAVETRHTRRIERLREGGRGTGPMIAEFVRCIADDRAPVVTGEAGLNDLEVVLAAYRSAESGMPVSPRRH